MRNNKNNSSPRTDSYRHLVLQKTAWAFGLAFVAGVAGVAWHQWNQQLSHRDSAALLLAKQRSADLRNFRSLYSSEVVDAVADHGIDVCHDYDTKAAAIPLPATFTIMLGNRGTNEVAPGGSTRLYSPYPFPWRRETGGLRDAFARDAWEALSERPQKAFHRIEQMDGRSVLRYATADLMRSSCIGCHNSHPESPKTDWSMGDLRGILEVDVPVDAFLSQSSTGQRESLMMIGGLLLFGITTVGLFVHFNRLRNHRAVTPISVAGTDGVASLGRAGE